MSSEVVESFGGAGYVEDTGVPRLLADAQVLSIWEGTTNVLSLDTLRAMAKGGALEALYGDAERRLGAARDAGLRRCVEVAHEALEAARAWVTKEGEDPEGVEAGARRFALTVGRTYELALLVEHAQWCLEHGHGPRAMAAARRLARNGVNQIADMELEDAKLLMS